MRRFESSRDPVFGPGPTTIATSCKFSNDDFQLGSFSTPDDTLRSHHFSQRLPAVSSAAVDRENHSAVVWRIGGRVERGHAVLPTGTAGRVWVRPFPDPKAKGARTNGGPRGIAAGKLRAVADSSVAVVETAGSGGSDAAHPAAVGRDHRAAVFSAVVDQSVVAG